MSQGILRARDLSTLVKIKPAQIRKRGQTSGTQGSVVAVGSKLV